MVTENHDGSRSQRATIVNRELPCHSAMSEGKAALKMCVHQADDDSVGGVVTPNVYAQRARHR